MESPDQVIDLMSNWVNRALVNSNFQLDVGSFDFRFQFQFGISNEIFKFLMNLQTSALEILALLMMSGTRRPSPLVKHKNGHLSLILKNWSD